MCRGLKLATESYFAKSRLRPGGGHDVGVEGAHLQQTPDSHYTALKAKAPEIRKIQC